LVCFAVKANSNLAVLQSVRDGNLLRFEGEVILSNDQARMGRPFVVSAQVHKNHTNLVLHLGEEKFSGRGFVLFGDGGR